MSTTAPPAPGAEETIREEAVWLVATLRHREPEDRSDSARQLVEMRASDAPLTYDHLEDMKMAAAEAGRLPDVERLVRDQRHVRSATWAVRQRHARSSTARNQRDRNAAARASMRSPEYAEARDRALAQISAPRKVRIHGRVTPTVPSAKHDRGGTTRPAPRTAGKRASVGDGNGGSSGSDESGESDPPAASRRVVEVPLPIDGPACRALRETVAELASIAWRLEVPLAAAVDPETLRSLDFWCRRRDFSVKPSAPAIAAVAKWRTDTIDRLHRLRPTTDRSAA